MEVIGVASQAQHGKDTLADRLGELLNGIHGRNYWKRAAFAHGVKQVFSDAFDVSREFIEDWKVQKEVPPGFDMEIRKGLQFIGDGFRKIRSTIWVDLAFRKEEPKIISDVRYPNEFTRVYEVGGLNILVGRTDRLNDDPNGSEALIKPYVEYALSHYGEFEIICADNFDEDVPEGMEKFHLFVRNDGTMDDFYKKVEEFVVPFVQLFFEGKQCHT